MLCLADQSNANQPSNTISSLDSRRHLNEAALQPSRPLVVASTSLSRTKEMWFFLVRSSANKTNQYRPEFLTYFDRSKRAESSN